MQGVFMSEKLIKSKARVQKHGEVFTPSWMVQKMLDTEGVKEACENIYATFLEPAAGDGNFLVAILRRKLAMVSEQFNSSIRQYTHYSLYALTTLYGIELLEDNAQMCVMNLFEVYKDFYEEAVKKHEDKRSENTLNNAKFIISKNIVQGNFLTRKLSSGDPIIFSEWVITKQTTTMIKVQRTEYSLDEIFAGNDKEAGTTFELEVEFEQIDLFSDFDLEPEPENEKIIQKYKEVYITEVYDEVKIDE
jgi:hypothetical protein